MQKHYGMKHSFKGGYPRGPSSVSPQKASVNPKQTKTKMTSDPFPKPTTKYA